MTLEEFLKHADDAIYMGNLDLLRPHAAQVFKERDEACAAMAPLTRTEARELVECMERFQAAGKMLSLLVERATAQRDEARAEVEKLRAALRASPSRW